MQKTSDLTRKRCFNHQTREAVALCLDCRQAFCRECITEHDGKMTCANCLSDLKSHGPKKKKLVPFFQFILFLSALFFLWFCFYQSGQLLIKLPSSFHEGTLWKELWQNS